MRVLAVPFVALFVLIALGIQSSRCQLMKDGKEVTGPNIGSAQGFRAQLWITEHEQFFEDFANGGNVIFDGSDHLHRNKPVFITLFISGPGLDETGAADVTADFIVRKPDGTKYFEGKDAPCWSGQYPYTPQSTQVADAKLKLRIETKDPLGNYTVEATVHDKLKHVDLHLVKPFDVAE